MLYIKNCLCFSNISKTINIIYVLFVRTNVFCVVIVVDPNIVLFAGAFGEIFNLIDDNAYLIVREL